jgi:hypothetical protein
MLPIRRWVASPLTSHDNRSSSALEKSFSIPTREGDFSSADGRPLLTITLCKEAYNLIEEKVEKRPVCYTFYTNTTIDEGKKKGFWIGKFLAVIEPFSFSTMFERVVLGEDGTPRVIVKKRRRNGERTRSETQLSEE